ncbi:MAG TPA: hypothetical protein VGQ53_04635 [Chitinophagaceae bacterium]|jgi:hypothetical protein|nr:hypothetical protein [Chitinophagaceae bacterium]
MKKMKPMFYKFTFRLFLVGGIIVGIVKGQDARQKWVSKKKIRYEARKAQQKTMGIDRSLVALDEIEMSTYHS